VVQTWLERFVRELRKSADSDRWPNGRKRADDEPSLAALLSDATDGISGLTALRKLEQSLPLTENFGEEEGKRR
jgi:hypothetical protein